MKPEERYEHYYNEGYNAGCVKGYEQAIKKACDLLRALDVFTEDFINDFRKVMKSRIK